MSSVDISLIGQLEERDFFPTQTTNETTNSDKILIPLHFRAVIPASCLMLT